MSDTLLLKLYYLYCIQNNGMTNLVEMIMNEGRQDLLDKNTEYVKSLMTNEQLSYWMPWSKEILSEEIFQRMMKLDHVYGVIMDINDPVSTHIQEYVPETKTILCMEM